MPPDSPSLVLPSPLQLLQDELFLQKNVRVFLKRDDLIHPEISGNKWRKLKYNLQDFLTTGKDSLLTFGGAYSNHIRATAAAGKAYGFNTVGIIRGDEISTDNPALRFARDCGMHLHFVSRDEYRHKNETVYQETLKKQFGNFFYLPEGGTNSQAVRGSAEIVEEIEIPFDLICCPCGTGGTLAGLAAGLEPHAAARALGFAVLKNAAFLRNDVRGLLNAQHATVSAGMWSINLDYHFGGYAKKTPELLTFIRNFYKQHGVMLDYVYNGKMLFGLQNMIQQGAIESGSTIIAVVTGGLSNASVF